MSLAKKGLDPSKLTLGPKRDIVKPGPSQEEIESAIQQIHEEPAPPEPKPAPVVEQPAGQSSQQRKRLTLDMDVTLHRTIKKAAIDRGLSIRDYLLGLAKIDMGIEEDLWQQMRK